MRVAARHEQNFRASVLSCPAVESGDSIALPPEAQAALMVGEDDSVICVRI